MRRLLRLLPAAVLLAPSLALAGDWVSIQPDAALSGWTRFPVPPGAPLDAPTQWHVSRDGNLVCDGAKEKGHEWLRYDRELRDFVLHVEWRFPPVEGEAKYNSGVYVRNSQDGGVWFQAQIGAPENAGYFFYDMFTRGSKARVNLKSEMPANPVKPPGEWNVYEIRAEGPQLTLSVNGQQTSSFLCGRLSGYLGLEAEHYKIEFRNLKLKELP